jgi:signal transduction histidine kinase
MSLFLKIFLWFWLSIALVVGVLTFVNWSMQSEPLTRQWQTFIGEAVNINSQTAVQIYENEGQNGLDEYLKRVAGAERVLALGIFNQNRQKFAGTDLAAESGEIFNRGFDADSVEFIRLPEKTIAAKKIQLKNGQTLYYVVEYRRMQRTPFLTEARNRILQILAVIFTAGLGCYALARYLSSPISKLRTATQKLASGDLQTRVADEVGNRHDELAALAKDFDEMAERIETLINSQKRLTRDVSHELRSPLARLNVALELAKTKSNGDTNNLLDRIEREGRILNDMISQILTLSKLESQSETIEKHDINIGKLVERVVADADFEAAGQGKKVEIIQNSDAKIFGNENLLRSAVENVLRNAVRYTKDKVEVSVNGGTNQTVIKIRDNGSGVPDDELEKLFTPFHRVAEARERKSGGVGLGLAIAEQAVHAHRGKISADNAKDGGLIVEIKLPHQN